MGIIEIGERRGSRRAMFAPEGISWTTLDRSDLRGVAPHGTNLTTVSHLSESLIAGIPCVLCKYDDTLCSRLEFSASSPAVFNDNATYERALSLSLSLSLLTHGAFFSFFPHTRTFAYLVQRRGRSTFLFSACRRLPFPFPSGCRVARFASRKDLERKRKGGGRKMEMRKGEDPVQRDQDGGERKGRLKRDRCDESRESARERAKLSSNRVRSIFNAFALTLAVARAFPLPRLLESKLRYDATRRQPTRIVVGTPWQRTCVKPRFRHLRCRIVAASVPRVDHRPSTRHKSELLRYRSPNRLPVSRNLVHAKRFSHVLLPR